MRKGHCLESSPLLVLNVAGLYAGAAQRRILAPGPGQWRPADAAGGAPRGRGDRAPAYAGAASCKACSEISTPSTGVCSRTACVMNCSLPSQPQPDLALMLQGLQRGRLGCGLLLAARTGLLVLQ